MIKVLSTTILLALSSCNIDMGERKEPNTISQPVEIKELGTANGQYDRYYQIYTLEGCEYIVVSPGNSHFTWGTHKGNCKNPIHKEKR